MAEVGILVPLEKGSRNTGAGITGVETTELQSAVKRKKVGEERKGGQCQGRRMTPPKVQEKVTMAGKALSNYEKEIGL